MAFRIDQAGIGLGTAGKSRTDGKLDGSLVTLTNTSGGTTLFQLLWVPPGDTTAVASLAATTPGGAVWTFAPTANRPGTYRIKLIRNQGLPNETSEVRVFRVRTATKGLPIPALNEVADFRASLLNNGPTVIAASEDNATDYAGALADLDYSGWWRMLHEWVTALEAAGTGGSGGGGYDVVSTSLDGLAPQTSGAAFGSVLGFDGGGDGSWVVPRHSRIYPVGSGYGLYSSIHAALAAIAADTAPSRDDRALILVYPGLYVSTTPYEIPAFVEVAGVSKFAVELYNDDTDMFSIQGDNTQFANFLIRGAANDSIYAFKCNNRNAIHIRHVDMLNNDFTSTQKFLEQIGNTWTILFLEHLVIDSYRTSDFSVLLRDTHATPRLCDVIVNDVFADTYHLTNYGGQFLIEGCKDVRFGACVFRGIAVYHTGVYIRRSAGQGGIPEFQMRNSYVEGAVTLYGELNTNYYLINSDALGALTAGTRTVRNSSV